MNIYFQLFLSFFKIGAFTFGGGWAMISIIEKEVVDKKGWLSREEFYDCLSVAQALPGIIAVNIAVAVGRRIGGSRGCMVASLGSILPSFLIILCIAIFLNPSVIKENAALAAIFKGIRPCVVALIIAPVISSGKAARLTRKTIAVPVLVALAVWSRWPVISNPVVYIVAAIVIGYIIETIRCRREGATQ